MLCVAQLFLFALFILQFNKPVNSIVAQNFSVCPDWNSTIIQCSDCQLCPDGSRCPACAPTSVSALDSVHNHDLWNL